MLIIRMILLIFLLFSAAAVCLSRKLLASIIIYASFGTVFSLIWILIISPDIAISEAAVGTGITGVLFFVVLKRIGVVEIEYLEEKRQERLENWEKKSGKTGIRYFYNTLSVIICISFTAILLYTVVQLPGFGDPNNPTNNEVPRRYLEEGVLDTGAINAVSAMLWSYRAFDTFGEASVLFVAVCSVLILVRGGIVTLKASDAFLHGMDEPSSDPILKKTAFAMISIIMTFGIYSILHGHISAGGGFSGGAILGASAVLYTSAFGVKRANAFIDYKTFCRIMVICLATNALAKGYSFIAGANNLPYVIPLGTPGNLLSGGFIPLMNIAVGATVACTLYVIFILFTKGDLN